MQLGQIFAFSTFSEYGADIPKEIMAEVFLAILTVQGSLFYNRGYGTTVKRAESRPINFSTELRLQNEIINSLQDYNENADDTTERRVAVPADSVKFTRGGPGELNVQFGYYQLRDLQYKQVVV